MLARTLFSIFLAFMPNLIVDSEYSNYEWVGFIHNIISVRELPPNEDRNILVNDEFL